MEKDEQDKPNIPADAITPNAKPGYKAGNTLIDKVEEEVKEDSLKLNEEVKKMIEEARGKLSGAGMLEKTISKYFEGVDIIDCYYCSTPNMYELDYNKKQHFSMYECANCKKTYMVKWGKKRYSNPNQENL